MDEFENPYICFNCKHVGKCSDAILHTHDVSACQKFDRYIESQCARVTLRQLSEMLGLSPRAIYGRIQYHGWGDIVDMFQARGIKVYREKSHVLDKRYHSAKHIYYIKR